MDYGNNTFSLSYYFNNELEREKNNTYFNLEIYICRATSAIRFFSLHDLMSKMKWKYMLHVESDNLLYEDLSRAAIPDLKAGYKRLAATMLSGSIIKYIF